MKRLLGLAALSAALACGTAYAQQVTVKISYQEADGFQLPKGVTALVARPNNDPINLALTFTSCRAKGR